MLITRQANAAHARCSPMPAETSIPRGIWADSTLTVNVLMPSAFLMATVQWAEPARMSILDTTAEKVAIETVPTRLIAPLCQIKRVSRDQKSVTGWYGRNNGYNCSNGA